MRALIALIGNILYYAILISAILSWFPQVNLGKFGDLLVSITEPIVGPCRSFLNSMSFFRELPLDLSPLLAMIIVNWVSLFLRMLI